MDIQQLSQCLVQTMSPDVNLRRPAERKIQECQTQPGYCQALLQLLQIEGAEHEIKQAAAICFKNFIKNNWVNLDDSVEDKISQNDRDFCKNVIIDLMLRSSGNVQRQLSEAVSIIGKEDFPDKWPNLLENMLQRVKENCAAYNFEVINGVLQTASSLFKRYQIDAKSQKLWEQIKFVMDTFAEPFTELFLWIYKLVPEHQDNAQNIRVIFHSLELCAEIFFSLNYQEYLEYFENTMDTWMTPFIEILQLRNPAIENNDDEANVLDNLKSQICEILIMFTEKYLEDFESYLPSFIQQVWNMLDGLTIDVKYDLLASNAIRFLSTVAERGVQKETFEKPEVLQQISTRIIIPSMQFRECDEELFEDNPEDYIRKDMEGADMHTRRRAACDFVKALSRHFEKPMTEVVSQYIQTMLLNFSQNERENWKSKDAAIYLVTSLAAKEGSVRLGATSTSDLINLTDFFNNVIRPDLQRPDVNELPVLKADALKYLVTFRKQLSIQEVLLPAMSLVVPHLSSKEIVIHSYAANCIEKILTLRDPERRNVTLVKGDDIAGLALPMLEGLIKIWDFPGSGENDFSVKALVRVFSLLQERLLPYFNVILPKLSAKVIEVARNPSKPIFNHYLFEVIALSINIACKANPEASTAFESEFFPIFTNVLSQEIQEFFPYFFQIFALIIEYKDNQQLSSTYMDIFGPLVSPQMWTNMNLAASLVRIIRAYIKNCIVQLISMDKFSAILGVFQKLIGSKINDQYGFALLGDLVMYAPAEALQPHMKQIFLLFFQRLSNSRTIKFAKHLMVFFSVYIFKYGAKAFYDMVESIQANMFQMVISRLFIMDAQKVNGQLNRKHLSIGMIKLITELDIFYTAQNLKLFWPQVLQAILAIFEFKEEIALDDCDHFVEIEDQSSYQASSAVLVFAAKKPLDIMAEISDPRAFLATSLARLSQSNEGLVLPLVQLMDQQAQNILSGYLANMNVTL